jgi:hypothetical protein
MAPDRAWVDCRSRTNALLLSLNRLRDGGVFAPQDNFNSGGEHNDRCDSTDETYRFASHSKSLAANETVRVIVRKPDRIFELGAPGREGSPCRYARDITSSGGLVFR